MHNTPHTESSKAKMGLKLKELWADPGFRNKVLEDRKHIYSSPEWRSKVSRGWIKKGSKQTNSDQLIKINKGNSYHSGKIHTINKPNRSRGYSYTHKWLYRNFGSPMTCENCGEEKRSNNEIHWANTDRIYEKDIKHFKRLCAKCHKRHDLIVFSSGGDLLQA